MCNDTHCRISCTVEMKNIKIEKPRSFLIYIYILYIIMLIDSKYALQSISPRSRLTSIKSITCYHHKPWLIS